LQAGHRRYAAAAGKDRRVARAAARLGDDARHLTGAERDDLRGKQLAGDEDQRFRKRGKLRLQNVGQVATDANHDVAQICQALFQVVVLSALKQLRVIFQQPVQGTLDAVLLVDDPGADLRAERGIVQNRLVSAKDPGFVRANLGGDFL